MAKILALKAEKEGKTSEHLCAVIYELITVLQLTSKLLYLLTHLSVTGIFSLFSFTVSSRFYFCNRESSSGAI